MRRPSSRLGQHEFAIPVEEPGWLVLKITEPEALDLRRGICPPPWNAGRQRNGGVVRVKTEKQLVMSVLNTEAFQIAIDDGTLPLPMCSDSPEVPAIFENAYPRARSGQADLKEMLPGWSARLGTRRIFGGRNLGAALSADPLPTDPRSHRSFLEDARVSPAWRSAAALSLVRAVRKGDDFSVVQDCSSAFALGKSCCIVITPTRPCVSCLCLGPDLPVWDLRATL